MKTKFLKSDSRRGSLLIVAMMLCAVIGISLVSYLHLSRTALNISNRAVYNNAAMNLSEQGIEEAMYSVNQLVASSSYVWPGWTLTGANATREWTGVGLSQNATASYRVYVRNYAGISAPVVVSRAQVSLGGGAPIEKWIEVTLSKTSKFSNGLVAKQSIVFNGNNATVDSWNSDKDTTTGAVRPSVVPYSGGVRNDNGSVGSISIASDAVLVKNADIWGYASTGGVNPATFVGSNGSILGEDSASGLKVDPARVSTNFSATFDAVSIPTETAITNLGVINNDLLLPRAADVAANLGIVGTDGNRYYYYDASYIDLVNKTLTISDRVVLRLSSTTGINVGGGSGQIAIGATGYFSVYTDGTVSIGGQGVSNGVDSGSPAGLQDDELGQPIQFQIWGTKTSGSQTITISGTGIFSGVIYAPQGDVSIVGNGAICGSVVANTIALSGNAQFHYDESLADFGGGNPFRVSKWKELTTAAERAAYASVINW